MAQYHINLNREILHHLFQNDEGFARLLEEVLNQVLQAQLTEQLQAMLYRICASDWIRLYRHGISEIWKVLSYPFLFVNALVTNVRENQRVRSRSILIAIGINEKGNREILGLRLEVSKTETNCTDLFSWLKQRGLKGVDLVVSDHYGGLVNAIKSQFQGCTW